MKPRTFRQAFAEKAGEELGRGIAALPFVALLVTFPLALQLIGDWYERRDTDSRAPKDSMKTVSKPPA